MNDLSNTYPTLRMAVAARMEEWDGKGRDPLPDSFYGLELAGEIGEFVAAALKSCNVLKKIERANYGHIGSTATIAELAREMADAMICLRRLEVRFGIDLDDVARRVFNERSEELGLKTRVHTGRREPPPPEDIDGVRRL